MRCADCDGILGECGCERRSKLHIDGTIAAANRAAELQAENASLHNELGGMELTILDLRNKLAECELRLDAHEDASTPAFDEIVKLCGLAKTWEYPAQVIRDVEDALKTRDAKIAELRVECGQHAMISADLRDDLDLWKQRATVDWSKGPYGVAPGQDPGEIRVTARNLADENRRIQEERTKDLHVMSRQGALIEELRTRLRVAEAVRDDAREASALDLEKRRDALEIAEACREDQRALAKRRDELLATIARLSNTVPFPDEWKDWEITRAKLVAEVGTMRARVATLEDIAKEEHLTAIKRNQTMLTQINELTNQKDGAYAERDRCVAGLATMAVRLGWDAWLGRHEPDPKWDQDWMNIVFVELPTGQVSWHVHDRELPWLSFLPRSDRKWDGHTTEKKYERLSVLSHVDPADICTEHTFVGDSCRDCGAPALVVEITPGHCPWILDDENPDEGYWHCKHLAGHSGNHETHFGFGRDRKWKMRGNLLPGDTSKAQKPPRFDKCSIDGHMFGTDDTSVPCARCGLVRAAAPIKHNILVDLAARTLTGCSCGFRTSSEDELAKHFGVAKIGNVIVTGPMTPSVCECSPRYLELAPGFHAAYCPLKGKHLDDGKQRWTCEKCNITWRASVGGDRCIDCGGPTKPVAWP